MINLEVANPMNGAAWRVLFERVRPADCFTRTRQAQIAAEFDGILAWAATQRQDVKASYEWAAKKLLADIENQLKCIDMNSQVAACYGNIARPPV